MIQKIKISELIVLENNPRTITKEGFEKLCKSIQQDPSFMDARPILVNNATGSFKVYGGNQRLLACKHLGWEEVPCDVQAIDEKTEKERVIKDNTHYGEFDMDIIANQFSDLDLNELGFRLDSMFKDLEEENKESEEEKYTSKVEAPIYSVSNEKPDIILLLNDNKTKELIQEITNSNIQNEEKEFLIKAANRHCEFNYSKIADYYAHASKEMQELMEKSALVIVDMDKAVESGFVIITKDIADQFNQENE